MGGRLEKPTLCHPHMDPSPNPETSPSSHPAGAAPADEPPQPRRPSPGWRWIFLCAEAALFSLSVVAVARGGYLHNDDHPIIAGIVVTVFPLTTVFLLFASYHLVLGVDFHNTIPRTMRLPPQEYEYASAQTIMTAPNNPSNTLRAPMV